MRKIWIATVAATVLASSPAWAINTYQGWDKIDAISSFGCPDTTEYGQVITIKNFKNELGPFSFWLKGRAHAGQSMVVRAEVYQWDGTKATGSSLYESAPRTIAYTWGTFHRETFFPKLIVTPGAQYVLFLTVDKDYDQCLNGYGLSWGAVEDTAYPGGTFVYLNDEGDSSQWTTTPWNIYGSDLVFRESQGSIK